MSDNTSFTQKTDILKVTEAASYLKVSKTLLYELIQKKQIPFTRVSERRIVIRKRDLDEWIEKRSHKSE
jgi:excisionase family DNA binding protein